MKELFYLFFLCIAVTFLAKVLAKHAAILF